MSDRLSRSSTKYGPSVSAGVMTQAEFGEDSDTPDDVEEDGDDGEAVDDWPPHPRMPAATNDPRE